MPSPCTKTLDSKTKLSRLGELMARAAARQRRSKALSIVEKPQSPAPTDPIEALFQTHADLSIGEVMDITDQSRTTAHRRLVELVERGILERRGEGKASRYHRTR